MSFTTDIERFVRKTGISGTQVMRKLGFTALSGVIQRSPVDTGRFRASNRIAINTTNLSTAAESEGNPLAAGAAGGAEISRANVALRQLKWGDSIHITNNLPYAHALENGSSQQAPGPLAIYGMTFQELLETFHNTVASVKRDNDTGRG